MVALYGYYGSRNLGDDLLLTVTIERLRPLMPDARFLVRDHGFASELSCMGQDASPEPVEAHLSDPQQGKAARFARYLRAWSTLLRRADWLIFGGGTVFHARGSSRSLLLQLAIVMLARRHRVRLAALGVGISELRTPNARRLMAAIARRFELFLVRDRSGLRQCPAAHAELSGDLVFAWSGLAALRPPEVAIDERARHVGLTVYPPACEDTRVVEGLRRAVKALQDAGFAVTYLVFQRPGAAVGDATVFEAISAGLEPARRPSSRTLAADAARLAADLADIGVVAGMRFHALVLAALLETPFAGLAHDNKISDLCARLGMPWLAVDHDPVETIGRGLPAAIAQLHTRRPDPADVAREVAAAEVNFERLAALLRGSPVPAPRR